MTKEAALTEPAPTTAADALRAHSPAVSAARARRWGAFYYAEQVLRVMKGYGWTIVMYGVGQPVAYLFAMGVGLATLVDTNSDAAFGGVSYLAFIAPALLISAAVMTAANEFTFPVMDGFKWRRVYYGPHASPLTPQQIALGQIIAGGGDSCSLASNEPRVLNDIADRKIQIVGCRVEIEPDLLVVSGEGLIDLRSKITAGKLFQVCF